MRKLGWIALQSKESESEYDVLIVGGGFAGVTVARELSHKGLRCILLEAKNRLGGRAFTVEFAQAQVELGGEWVHWTQPHVWSEITRYGLDVQESSEAREQVWLAQGKLVSGASLENAYSLILQQISELFREGTAIQRPYDLDWYEKTAAIDELAVQDRIDKLELPSDCKDLLAAMICSSCSAPCSNVSLLWIQHTFARVGYSLRILRDSLERYRLRRGVEFLLKKMMADADVLIELSTPIERIENGPNAVRAITASGRSITASRGVLAVPVNVVSKIDVWPPLSAAKQAMTGERHAGRGVKVWCHVKGIPMGFFALGLGAPLSQVKAEYSTIDGTIVVGFGNDNSSIDIDDRNDVERALRIFSPKVKLLEIAAHDWTRDPFSMGTWFAPRPGQITRYLPEFRRPEGRLWFATGDIASGWSGTIDGAIESGLRVSREIIDCYVFERDQTNLTVRDR